MRRIAAAGLAAAALAAAAGCASIAPRPLSPSVALEGVRITRLLPNDTRLAVAVAVDNPNAYDLVVGSLDATLSVDGEPLFTATLPAPATLPAQASARVELEARTALPALAAALDRFARQRTVAYELAGTVVVQNGWPLPFRRRGELPGIDFLGQRR